MPKRKEQHVSDEESDDGSNDSLLQVSFDFNRPTPIDYTALTRLLVQLFQSDAEMLQPRELVDLILSQSHIGSVVKIADEEEGDPLAVLSVLNMRVHQANPAIQALRTYLLSKTSSDPAFQSSLQSLFDFTSQGHDVGLVLSERLINLPVQIAPPMWRMLGEEIGYALDEDEPFRFSHFLVVSRTYRAPSDAMSDPAAVPTPPSKRAKTKTAPSKAAAATATYPYHEEDAQISEVSLHTLDYPYTHALPREEGGFGLDMGGRVMLFEAGRLNDLVELLQTEYAP